MSRKFRGGVDPFIATDATIRDELARLVLEGNLREISQWDVSEVTDMSNLLKGLNLSGVDFRKWNTLKVTNMRGMFSECTSIPSLTFDVSNVTDMRGMFEGCTDFDKNVWGWNVSNVQDMSYMFSGCIVFNKGLASWNVSNVTQMEGMFKGCTHFNHLGKTMQWGDKTSKVVNMESMFEGCTNFNQDLSKWNVDNVTNWVDMFKHCRLRRAYKPKFKIPEDEVEYGKLSVLFNPPLIQQYTERLQLQGIRLFCNDEVFTQLQITSMEELYALGKINCMGAVTDDYKKGSFKAAFKGSRSDQIELLCAIDERNALIGFIIGELGECRMLQEVWSVRLICVPKSPTKISSTLLLGAMMYAIKEMGGNFAVLELANAYDNIPGFIAYSKLGFIKNLSLYNYRPVPERPNIHCFKSLKNLPMYVSLQHLTQDDIVDLVANRKFLRLTPEQDDTTIFEKYLQKKQITEEMMVRSNEEYRAASNGIAEDVVLTDQVYSIENRTGGQTVKKRKTRKTRKTRKR
jgi:surface protein